MTKKKILHIFKLSLYQNLTISLARGPMWEVNLLMSQCHNNGNTIPTEFLYLIGKKVRRGVQNSGG